MSREQRVVTGNPVIDRYFATVWEVQRTLANADLRRADALSQLALSVAITQDADADHLANTVRRSLAEHHVTSVDVSVEHNQQTFTALQAWIAATVTTPDGTSDARFVRLEGSLTVTVTCHGGESAAMARTAQAAAAVLRRADALQAVMEVLAPTAQDLVARGQALAVSQPQWRSECLAAAGFAASVGPRATAHAEESRRMALWVRAAMVPDQ